MVRNKFPKSQKEPGLLKEEARITRGWFLAPSPKCYILAQMEPNDLEKEFLTSKDPFKVLKTWNQSTEPKNEIKKRSSKGCKRSINLSYVNVFFISFYLLFLACLNICIGFILNKGFILNISFFV